MSNQPTGQAARPTASGISRAHACPAAYALPATWEESGPAALRGQHGHTFLEALQSTTREAALAAAPEDLREQLAALDVSNVARGDAEVGFAVDVPTNQARPLGHISGRKYPTLALSEIGGIADLVVDGGSGVIDWKFGNIDYVEPAADSHQLAFHALALSRVHGLDSVRVAIAHVDLDASRITYDWHEHDAMSLEWIANDLREIHASVRKAREQLAAGVVPQTNPGAHCKWCPAAKACPSMANDARALATVAESTWMARVNTELDEPGGIERWHLRLPILRSIVDAISDEVRARVKVEGPIALANGGTLTIEKRTRSSTDHKAVFAELVAAVGPDAAEAIAAQSTKTTHYEQLTERKARKGTTT